MDSSPTSTQRYQQPRTHRTHPTYPLAAQRSQAETERILEELQNETGYRTEQENGLRRLLIPREQLPADHQMGQQRGCEIFLGRLPTDTMEDELFRVCTPFGQLLEIRLMLQQDGLTNRGYAFIVFSKREEAKAAIDALDKSEIRAGHRIGARRSVDNCRLFMGGLPRDKTKREFETEIRKHPICESSMCRVIMYQSVQDKTKNRGFAFVEFASHRDAAIARRQLMREKVALWGKEICVDWAQPEAEVEQDVMDQVRVVYVRNLLMTTTEEDLREMFQAVAVDGAIEKVKKLRDFAFVHFEKRNDAQRAIDQLDGNLLDGSQLELEWAKPPAARKQMQQFVDAQPRGHDHLWSHINPAVYHQYQMSQNVPLEIPIPFPYTNRPLNGQVNAYRSLNTQQRHYRNAAGTRRRYEIQDGSNGMMHMGMPMMEGYNEGYHGQQYNLPEHLAGYQTFYNPAVVYQQQGLPYHHHHQPLHPHHQPAAHLQQHAQPQLHSHVHSNGVGEMMQPVVYQMANMHLSNGNVGVDGHGQQQSTEYRNCSPGQTNGATQGHSPLPKQL